MFTVTTWDERATIEYTPPDKVIDSGNEDEYFELRPLGLPSDENEFIIFEAAKLELVARLRAKAELLLKAAVRLADLTEEAVVATGEERHKPKSYQERAAKVVGDFLDPGDPDFEEDLGPQGEELGKRFIPSENLTDCGCGAGASCRHTRGGGS